METKHSQSSNDQIIAKLNKIVYPVSVKELRIAVTDILNAVNTEEASAIANIIIMKRTETDKTALLIGSYIPTKTQFEAVKNDIFRAAKGEPVHYITNQCEFMSTNFYVKPGVLIPRTDTEVLVETCNKVIKEINLKQGEKVNIWDICCGSGCIGLSVAKCNQNAYVTLCDISDDALSVTEKNIEMLGLGNRTKVAHFDVNKDQMTSYAHIVVSNPPYIETDTISKLDDNVKLYEPTIALDGGKDGLDFYRIISSSAKIKKGGYLIFEIGYNQGNAVREILKDNGYTNIKIIKDIENRDRVLLATAT